MPRRCGIATFTTHLADAFGEVLPHRGRDGPQAIGTYDGAADTSVALATGSIKQMLDWLDRHGPPPTA